MLPMVERRALLVLLALSVALAGAGCKSMFGGLPQEEGLHPRLTRFAYLEEGKLISLAVDTEAARQRDAGEYVPLFVGVANNGLDRIVLDRESFTLVDEEGNRYALASIPEVREARPPVEYDLKLTSQFRGVWAGRFDIWPEIPAVFFPVGANDVRYRHRGLARDRVELSMKTWMKDLLYFPMPETGLVGHRFELWLDTEEMEQPVFVKFAVK